MKRWLVLGYVLSLGLAAAAGAQDPPEPGEVVERMIEASGGEDAFRQLGLLKLDVTEEETRMDGSQESRAYQIFVDTSDLARQRRDDPAFTIAMNEATAWAIVGGTLDERKQTPYRVRTTLNQSTFILLLPFSLEMEGVWPKEIEETVWEGREAWHLKLPFAKGFFATPVMTTTWDLYVAKDDYSILALSFVPPVELQKVEVTGIRYRIVKHADVDDVKIPSQIVSIGTNVEGTESGAFRVTTIEPEVYGPSDPALFAIPEIPGAAPGR